MLRTTWMKTFMGEMWNKHERALSSLCAARCDFCHYISYESNHQSETQLIWHQGCRNNHIYRNITISNRNGQTYHTTASPTKRSQRIKSKTLFCHLHKILSLFSFYFCLVGNILIKTKNIQPCALFFYTVLTSMKTSCRLCKNNA